MKHELPFTELPEGTVTFLFTDIEGSTQILKRLGEDFARVLAENRRILRESCAHWKGQEVDTQGDSFFASFPSAKEAVAAAAEIQKKFADFDWPLDIQVRVRMGLHTGEPIRAEEGYVGMDVHRAARIGSVGHGGQILLSETTALLIQDELPKNMSLRDLDTHSLKGVKRPERIFQLDSAGLTTEFPVLKTEETLPFIIRRWRENRPQIWRCVRRCGIAGTLVMIIVSLLSILQFRAALPDVFFEAAAAIPLPIWVFTSILLGLVWGGLVGLGAGLIYGFVDALEPEKPRWYRRAFLGSTSGLIHSAFILFTASTSGSWTNTGPEVYVPTYLVYGLILGASYSFVIPRLSLGKMVRSQATAIFLAFIVAGVAGLASVTIAYRGELDFIYYQLDAMMFLLTALLYPIGFTIAFRSR